MRRRIGVRRPLRRSTGLEGAAGGRRALATTGWTVIAPLALLALAWLAGLDRWLLPASLGLTLLPVVFLPAWVVAIGAAAGRRWPLAATAACVVAVHLAAVFPTVPLRPAAVDDGGTGLRMVTANASFRNDTPEAWATDVLALDADVLLVQEYAPEIADALVAAGVDGRYRWQMLELRPYSAGVATFSRFPLKDRDLPAFGDDGGFLATSVVLDRVDVRVLNVHTVALPDRSGWRESFADLQRYLDDQPHPLIAAGDFNATLWHSPMRGLLDGPLRDAHADRGRGLATTWPADGKVGPFALLDHVLVAPTIEVESVGERSLPGSDHRAVIADVRLAA